MKILSENLITSRNNPLVKYIASLGEKKWRNKEKSFIAEGEKLTLEALKSGLPITVIAVREDKREEFLQKISAYICDNRFADTEIVFFSESAFEKISTEKSPEGVISVIKHLDFFKELDIIYKEGFFIPESQRALLLCSVRDPHNLGSVIRSAVAFGVEHIVLSSDSAELYNPKTLRSAMGSLFKIKVTRVADIAQFIEAAIGAGRRVFAAELRSGARSVKEVGVLPSDIFMIGNEGHGIPEDISSICTGSVYIPISENTESLNASVAAAIFMWEQNK
jgi:TrmH family RNA methyltransferase